MAQQSWPDFQRGIGFGETDGVVGGFVFVGDLQIVNRERQGWQTQWHISDIDFCTHRFFQCVHHTDANVFTGEDIDQQ